MFWGAGSGVACAVILGIAILTAYYRFQSAFFSGAHKATFEGCVQLAACIMITPVSFAMLRMLSMYGKWEARMEAAVMTLKGPDRYAFFLMAFTATFREGVEAVVFITGVSQANPTAIPLPGVLGLLLGSVFSYFVFFGAKPVDIRPFMYVTAFVMFAIGAGLISRAFHAFQMAGYFGSMGNSLGPDYADYSYSMSEYEPARVPEEPAWVNVALGHFRGCCSANDKTTNFYSVLRAVFGYADRPTRLEIIVYMLYWGYVIVSLSLKYRAGTLYGKFAAPAPAAQASQPAAEGDEEMAKLAGEDSALVTACKGPGCEEIKPCEACTVSKPENGHEASEGQGAALRHRGNQSQSDDEGLEAAPAEPAAPSGRFAALLARLRAKPRTAHMLAAAMLAATLFALLLGLLLPRPRAEAPIAVFTLVIARDANASLAMAPAKPQITINGQWPGPTLRVALGSRVRVTIVNDLTQGEATAVHWHGMLQRGTPWQDGVVGVTQCPIAPVPGANSLTVEFTPDRAGTFWYHGHMGGQIVDGLFGPLIVDDGGASVAAAGAPAFVADDWVWMLSDWYNTPACWPNCDESTAAHADTMLGWYMSPASEGLEPIPDAIVVNNKPSGELTYTVARNAPQRVRIINGAALSLYNVSVDGMPLTVIELDGVAIAPLVLPWLVLNVAQRASIVLDWSHMHPSLASASAVHIRVAAMAMYMDMAPSAGGMNSTTSTLAGAPVEFSTSWVGTIAFAAGAQPAYPAAAAPVLAAAPPQEVNLLAARPFPAHAAPNATQFMSLAFGFANDPDSGVNMGFVNNVTYKLPPAALAVPLLRSFTLAQPLTVPSALSGTLAGDGLRPFVLPHARVVEVHIANYDNGEHPFHLHGHNFWVVATSVLPEAETLFAPNYVRRDVVSLPPNGWAKIRFVADNPGVWLFHCHIEWCVACSPILRLRVSVLTRFSRAGTCTLGCQPPSWRRRPSCTPALSAARWRCRRRTWTTAAPTLALPRLRARAAATSRRLRMW